METLLKIGILILCAWLWRRGGDGDKYMRRIILPIVIGLYYSFNYIWWAVLPIGGAYALGTALGYGEDTWFWKIFKKGWIVRGFVTMLVALIGSIPVVLITSHSVYLSLLYCLLSAVVSGTLSYLLIKDIIIEPVIGACIASVILFMG